MLSAWTGLTLCGFVIYFGIVHSTSNPMILLNPHALILVLGGTVAIGFLTYSREKLLVVLDYVLFGFVFRLKKSELRVSEEIIAFIDHHYKKTPTFEISDTPHPFLVEAYSMVRNPKRYSLEEMEKTLLARRNATKRRYIEDAKILNNIAKYPPHLGLLGAASGMIEMMSGLGKGGIDSIGGAMAVALSATLWGVGLNNFVFLPLADNSMKSSEDEIYLRDIMIECCLMMRQKKPYQEVIETCFNRLAIQERVKLRLDYQELKRGQDLHDLAG
jgi:chemotaxis protein MotA